MKIAISSESTIDLPKSILEEFEIDVIPFNVILGEEERKDGEIQAQDLFDYVEKTKKLPKTAAVNSEDYKAFWNELLKTHDAVIHFCLSSKISAACSNALLAASETPNVYAIDSLSLSTGVALQAIYARKLANAGKTPEEIVSALQERIPHDQASFCLETVNFLYLGGRCSGLAKFGANLLKLKPEIYVTDGSMHPGNKYRGSMMKVVNAYVEDTLKEFDNIDPELVFITFSSAPDDVVEAVKQRLIKAGFKRIEPTHAGATITTYCGPHCLGILYFNDGPHPLA